MVNVNISKNAWRQINNFKEPGETFAQSLDRMIAGYVPVKYICEKAERSESSIKKEEQI